MLLSYNLSNDCHPDAYAHAQDPSFVQPSTKQRLFELTDLRNCKVQSVTEREGMLAVQFTDGHVSTFTLSELLAEFSASPQNCTDLPPMQMWSARDDVSAFEWRAEELVRVGPGNTLRAREEGLGRFAEHVCSYGLAIIRGLPAAEGVCAEFARLVGVIRDTNWGSVFNVENKAAFRNTREHGVSSEDVAYTNLGIPLHVDNPYREVMTTIGTPP